MRYFILIFFIISGPIIGQEYIQIIKPDINIRFSPTTASTIVGHAFDGEVYVLNGENEKWYSVLMPSGESRWIYKTLVEKIELEDTLSNTLDLLEIQEELKIASDKANQDANTEIIGQLNKIDVNNSSFSFIAIRNVYSKIIKCNNKT